MVLLKREMLNSPLWQNMKRQDTGQHQNWWKIDNPLPQNVSETLFYVERDRAQIGTGVECSDDKSTIRSNTGIHKDPHH